VILSAWREDSKYSDIFTRSLSFQLGHSCAATAATATTAATAATAAAFLF